MLWQCSLDDVIHCNGVVHRNTAHITMEYSPFIIMDSRNLNKRSKDRNELLLSFCKRCMSLEQSQKIAMLNCYLQQ